MKMLLAVTIVGAAIAGLLLYAQRPAATANALPGTLDGALQPDGARGAHAMG